MALQWPSVRTRVLCIKLGFLLKILNSENSLSARAFQSSAVSDVEALHLIRQCQFLESSLNTNLPQGYSLPIRRYLSLNSREKSLKLISHFCCQRPPTTPPSVMCWQSLPLPSPVGQKSGLCCSGEGCFWYLLLSHTAQTTQSTHTFRQQMPCSQLLLCSWRRLPLLSLSS